MVASGAPSCTASQATLLYYCLYGFNLVSLALGEMYEGELLPRALCWLVADRNFFSFSNAALLKTVAVMSLQTLGQKEADNYSLERQKQNQNKPQPKQTTQHTKSGSGCGKRDVKRVVRNDVRQPANSLFKSPHTLRCAPPENTIAKVINSIQIKPNSQPTTHF